MFVRNSQMIVDPYFSFVLCQGRSSSRIRILLIRQELDCPYQLIILPILFPFVSNETRVSWSCKLTHKAPSGRVSSPGVTTQDSTESRLVHFHHHPPCDSGGWGSLDAYVSVPPVSRSMKGF